MLKGSREAVLHRLQPISIHGQLSYDVHYTFADEPGIQLIKGIHEGAVIAMADGYARASGKLGMVIVADIGLPNAMTQMVNSWKDQIPLMVAVACVDQDALGREQFQASDHVELMTQPITKWYWQAQTTNAIPETTRPKTVYLPSSDGVRANTMKNELLALAGSSSLAIDTMPRSCGVGLNSGCRFLTKACCFSSSGPRRVGMCPP